MRRFKVVDAQGYQVSLSDIDGGDWLSFNDIELRFGEVDVETKDTDEHHVCKVWSVELSTHECCFIPPRKS